MASQWISLASQKLLQQAAALAVVVFLLDSLLFWGSGFYRISVFMYLDHIIGGGVAVGVYLVGARKLPRLTRPKTLKKCFLLFFMAILVSLDRLPSSLMKVRGNKIVYLPPIVHSFQFLLLSGLVVALHVIMPQYRHWSELFLLSTACHLIRDWAGGGAHRGSTLRISPFPAFPTLPYSVYIMLGLLGVCALVGCLKDRRLAFTANRHRGHARSGAEDSLLPTTRKFAPVAVPGDASQSLFPSSSSLSSPAYTATTHSRRTPYKSTLDAGASTSSTYSGASQQHAPVDDPAPVSGSASASAAYDRALAVLREQGVYLKNQ
jgi:hypothetical protein